MADTIALTSTWVKPFPTATSFGRIAPAGSRYRTYSGTDDPNLAASEVSGEIQSASVSVTSDFANFYIRAEGATALVSVHSA